MPQIKDVTFLETWFAPAPTDGHLELKGTSSGIVRTPGTFRLNPYCDLVSSPCNGIPIWDLL